MRGVRGEYSRVDEYSMYYVEYSGFVVYESEIE